MGNIFHIIHIYHKQCPMKSHLSYEGGEAFSFSKKIEPGCGFTDSTRESSSGVRIQGGSSWLRLAHQTQAAFVLSYFIGTDPRVNRSGWVPLLDVSSKLYGWKFSISLGQFLLTSILKTWFHSS